MDWLSSSRVQGNLDVLKAQIQADVQVIRQQLS